MAVKVLYVMGHGWSGSTILGNVLAELPSFLHVGELRTIWGEALPEGRACGCGKPIGACEVWTEILREAFGQPLSIKLEDVASWHREAVRVRHTRRLLRLEPGRSTGSNELDSYLPIQDRLYAAIARATGSRVVVDTSKRTGDAAILRLMPGVDPYFVHLVRDPRAVAYSWRKREPPRHGPVRTMREWIGANLTDEAVRRSYGRGRSIRVRYEDFVARPRETVESIAALVGESPGELPLQGRTVTLGVHHTVSGNPSRFDRGTVELVDHEEWRTKLSSRDRVAVTSLAWPLMLRYRYPSGTNN